MIQIDSVGIPRALKFLLPPEKLTQLKQALQDNRGNKRQMTEKMVEIAGRKAIINAIDCVTAKSRGELVATSPDEECVANALVSLSLE